MKKSIAICLVLIMCAVSLCACSTPTNLENSNSNSNSLSQTETALNGDSSDLDSADDNNSTSADALFTWTFKFDGNEYTLPCDYSEFANNGWKIDADNEDETLDSNTYTMEYLKKGNKSVSVYIWNPTDSSIKYSECKIGQIKVEFGNEVSLEFSDGFVFDSTVTADTIMNRYGNPEDSDGTVSEKDDYTILEYHYSAWQKVQFTFYFEENWINSSSVAIENMD